MAAAGRLRGRPRQAGKAARRPWLRRHGGETSRRSLRTRLRSLPTRLRSLPCGGPCLAAVLALRRSLPTRLSPLLSLEDDKQAVLAMRGGHKAKALSSGGREGGGGGGAKTGLCDMALPIAPRRGEKGGWAGLIGRHRATTAHTSSLSVSRPPARRRPSARCLSSTACRARNRQETSFLSGNKQALVTQVVASGKSQKQARRPILHGTQRQAPRWLRRRPRQRAGRG